MLGAVRSVVIHLTLASFSANSLLLIEIGSRGCRGPITCTADVGVNITKLWQINNIAPDYVVKLSPMRIQGHDHDVLDSRNIEVSGYWRSIELTSHVNFARFMLILLGLLFLVIPELHYKRRFSNIKDLRDAFSHLVNRIAFAWLILCMSYIFDKPFITVIKDKPSVELQLVSEAEQRLAGLHESATSFVGLLGVCAVTSVLSTLIWYVGYVFVHWSAPSEIRHSTFVTLHFILLAITLQYVEERPVAQLIHYLLIKVIGFQSSWRLVMTLEPILLDRVMPSSPVRQLIVVGVLLAIAMQQKITSFVIENTMESDEMLTQWLTFPVSLLKGLVAGLVAEYVIRIVAKRTTWLFGFAEDDVYLYALTTRKLTNVVLTWNVLGDLAAASRDKEMFTTFLSCIFIGYILEAIFSLTFACRRTTLGRIFASMTSLPVAAGDHPQICSICLITMLDPSACHVTPCGHAFHKRCIESWFEVKSTCFRCGRLLQVENVTQRLALQ